MHFAIHITAAPQHDNALRAWRYTDACLSAGHSVVRVFFSGAAVAHGNRLNTPGRDETGLTQRWQTLAKTHGVELIICVAAALRHGVLDAENASRWEQPSHNLADGFSISGLGQLADAMLQADRYVCFSD
ncbi:MAG: sulfurtransferase complex subunit TusD [Moraxellaceae bacterium]|nr:sulfurtransferase complex subunit TusD [Moraxellaceae bacterium]